MIRTPAQYQATYDNQASKYLDRRGRYITGLQKGEYLENGGILSLLFNFAQAEIDLEQTDTRTANNVLDKIIVST